VIASATRTRAAGFIPAQRKNREIDPDRRANTD
jgi:hypothetical protein